MAPNKSTTVAGITFNLQAAPQLSVLGDWVLDTLVKMKQGGAALQDGSRIQLGWSMLTLVEQQPRSYIVCEPDFEGNPFEDLRPNVDKTLIGQTMLNEFSTMVNIVPVFPSFQDKVVFEKGCLDSTEVFMNRSSPQQGDSGWFIGYKERSNDGRSLEAIYVYDLFNRRSDLFPALALPPGYVVISEGRGIKAVLDEQDQVAWSDS